MSNLHNPESREAQQQIEQGVYRALTRTSAALYRAYVLRNGDDLLGARIEVIWAVLTTPQTLLDGDGAFTMETPMDQVYGRFIIRECGYSPATENIVQVDAEYQARFTAMSDALTEADQQVANAVQGLCRLLIIHHTHLDVLAECLRKATNAAALIRTLRAAGKETNA